MKLEYNVKSIKQVAIIPARGGSKSIPLKNLIEVNGKSLLARAIELAFKADNELVYVSTDSVLIADIATSLGARVCIRPAKLSQDLSSSETALNHVITNEKIELQTRISFIQATSPFTSSRDLKNAQDLTRIGTSVFSAVTFHNFLWSKNIDQWHPVGHNKLERKMKEELSDIVSETGNFYCFFVKDFLRSNSRFGVSSQPFLINPITNFQIDSKQDLESATLLSKLFN